MNEIKTWYLGLPADKKQVFLALVSHQLTIHGRAFGLDLSGQQQIEAFKGLNKLQHQIRSHVAAIGLSEARYPDDVLWNILLEKAAHYQISLHLAQSFQFARSLPCWTKTM
ncbi:MAG TPA: hypothetical protein VFB76_07610 [Candidatus Angelobacter sp.]|nr:hypothetical protein [Candidatus Angelobacter sp.]